MRKNGPSDSYMVAYLVLFIGILTGLLAASAVPMIP